MVFGIRVTGPHACFKRPEFSHDCVTYDVPTPMAARGLFEAVHWTPATCWRIDTIVVEHAPRMQWMSLIEAEAMGARATPSARIFAGRRDERRMCCLTDVSYVITAHFEMIETTGPNESVEQHAATFQRRLREAQYFRPPYLGVPCFPATIAEASPEEGTSVDAEMAGRRDLGWMLHDVHGDGVEGPRFFRAILQDGVIDLTTDESRFLSG